MRPAREGRTRVRVERRTSNDKTRNAFFFSGAEKQLSDSIFSFTQMATWRECEWDRRWSVTLALSSPTCSLNSSRSFCFYFHSWCAGWKRWALSSPTPSPPIAFSTRLKSWRPQPLCCGSRFGEKVVISCNNSIITIINKKAKCTWFPLRSLHHHVI